MTSRKDPKTAPCPDEVPCGQLGYFDPLRHGEYVLWVACEIARSFSNLTALGTTTEENHAVHYFHFRATEPACSLHDALEALADFLVVDEIGCTVTSAGARETYSISGTERVWGLAAAPCATREIVRALQLPYEFLNIRK